MDDINTKGQGARRGRQLGPQMLFVLERLAANPDASFQEVHDVAALAGLSMTYPLYARAKARLGLTKKREVPQPITEVPDGERTKLEERGRSDIPPASRTTPTPRPKTPGSHASHLVDFQSLAASIRELEADRDRMRSAIEQIAGILEGLPKA